MLKAIIFAAIGLLMVNANKYDDYSYVQYPTPVYNPSNCTSTISLSIADMTGSLMPESSMQHAITDGSPCRLILTNNFDVAQQITFSAFAQFYPRFVNESQG